MNASTATADTLLRQAWPRGSRTQAGGLAPPGLDVLFQVRLGPSGLCAPVSHGVLAVSLRTVMNNVGQSCRISDRGIQYGLGFVETNPNIMRVRNPVGSHHSTDWDHASNPKY